MNHVYLRCDDCKHKGKCSEERKLRRRPSIIPGCLIEAPDGAREPTVKEPPFDPSFLFRPMPKSQRPRIISIGDTHRALNALRAEQQARSVWQCADGSLIPIKEMTDEHLANTIAMLERMEAAREHAYAEKEQETR